MILYGYEAPLNTNYGTVNDVMGASVYAADFKTSYGSADGSTIWIQLIATSAVTHGQIQTVLNAADLTAPSIADGYRGVQSTAEAAFAATPGLATATAAQAEAYIIATATDLAGAVTVLTLIAKLLVALRNARWPHIEDQS